MPCSGRALSENTRNHPISSAAHTPTMVAWWSTPIDVIELGNGEDEVTYNLVRSELCTYYPIKPAANQPAAATSSRLSIPGSRTDGAHGLQCRNKVIDPGAWFSIHIHSFMLVHKWGGRVTQLQLRASLHVPFKATWFFSALVSWWECSGTTATRRGAERLEVQCRPELRHSFVRWDCW